MVRKLKETVKRIIASLPGKKYIVFESRPNFSDNTRAVFDEMVRRGLDQKYKLYWWVQDGSTSMPGHPNVGILNADSFWGLQHYRWVAFRAKALICCNAFLQEGHSQQKAFYLTHGTALKRLKSYHVPEGISYMLVASEHVRPTMARDFHMDPDRVYALGYPRNDALTGPGRDLKTVFPGEFRKVIVWYPTFRQNKTGSRTGAVNALPVIHDAEAAVRLNAAAKENGILIVVKPHFAQDISYITKYDLSNILFIDDSFFEKNALSSYEFVGSCDALITDYSSIYFDYLLCDKPVAVVWEDIEDYRKNPGFAMDPEVYMAGSHKIYTLEDFQQFLHSVGRDEDPFREERNRLSELLNYAPDGRNAQRVTDFIMEKAKL